MRKRAGIDIVVLGEKTESCCEVTAGTENTRLLTNALDLKVWSCVVLVNDQQQKHNMRL